MKLKRLCQNLKKCFWKILYFNDSIRYARMKGVTIGKEYDFTGHPNFVSEPYLIRIGNHVMVSFGCVFITHDGAVYTAKGLLGRKDLWKYEKIDVGNNVSIGARCTILPGVRIGDNAVIGAGAVVTKSIPSGEVGGGVPASYIMKTSEYVNKLLLNRVEFDMEDYKNNKKRRATQ